jgi:hypothetical protein
MNFHDLLLGKHIDPQRVLVLRHVPKEPELKNALPSLAAGKPEIFNAYQQTQTKRVEEQMQNAEYVASFIGRERGKALFVGLYANNGSRPITPKEYWKKSVNIDLKAFGVEGFTDEVARDEKRPCILWFDLKLTEFYAEWRGKLIVRWPPPGIAWHRWAHRPKNKMPVHAVLEDSALDAAMPKWQAIDLTWNQLRLIPKHWETKFSEWRCIYYIFDTLDGKGYVGAAYGDNNLPDDSTTEDRGNLFKRWRDYAARGHGGNKLLRDRDPGTFRYTILERVSPDTKKADVIRLESSWKDRLHTRSPFGLNDN